MSSVSLLELSGLVLGSLYRLSPRSGSGTYQGLGTGRQKRHGGLLVLGGDDPYTV